MPKPSLRILDSQNDPDHAQPRRGKPLGQCRAELELDRISGAAEPKTVSLPLGKLVPLLIDAATHDRAWLGDFQDDPVRIDVDLYDVLLAYQQLRQRAA